MTGWIVIEDVPYEGYALPYNIVYTNKEEADKAHKNAKKIDKNSELFEVNIKL